MFLLRKYYLYNNTNKTRVIFNIHYTIYILNFIYNFFQLYGEYFDKEMFEYVLNLVYNLPKSEASVIYNEMTDKPNEIKLCNYYLFLLIINTP